MKTTTAELLYLPPTEELRFLPEGPTSAGVGKFSWVAIQHGASTKIGSLNFFDISTGKNLSYELPGRPGFAKPTSKPGVYVIGCERELGLFDISDGSWEVLCRGIDKDVEGTIINDGTLYADNIVFGTKDLEFATPKAGLYLYRGSDQNLIQLRSDQICSNGKDVVDSVSSLSLIDIDSPTRKLVRYQLAIGDGTLSASEVVVDFSDVPGVPDGMLTTPDEQSVIISFYNPDHAEAGQTRQYSLLDGSHEHTWLTPGSPQATCPLLLECADGTVKLIITTAVEHMAAERRATSPNAGGIFAADTKFKTSPSTPAFPIN